MNKLKVVDESAFENSDLRFVIAKLEKIGPKAFKNCRNLEFIDLSRIKVIPVQAFKNCYKLGN